VIALVAIIAVSLRRPVPRGAPKPIPTRSDAQAVVESTAGRSARFFGAKQDVLIEHYDWMGQYPDGRTKVTGGTFKILQRAGRDFVVKAKEAEMKGQAPNVDVAMKGAVDITASDGLTLKTEEATYASGEAIVRAPGPVAFSRNRMVGTAVGMTYDKNRDVLWLLDKVVIDNQADEKGEGRAHIEAGSAGFARADKYTRFTNGVKMDRDGQVIQAEGAVAYLTPDEKRIQMLELRGSSRVVGMPTTDGGLKSMTARDINLTYAEDGKTLQRALLNGNGVIELAGEKGVTARKLSAEFIDIGLGPDGAVVTALFARNGVQLDLLADKTTPARTIRAGALEGSGTPAAGLTGATFTENVDFREMPAPPAAPRVAKSQVLDLALKNGFSSIESAKFGGGVLFAQGDLTASSRDARYAITAGTLALSGADEKTGRRPQVLDTQATIEARTIDIVLEGNKITAVEGVKTEMRDSGQKGGAPGQQTRRPAILKPDKPVYATSDRLDYDSDASHAVYTGSSQLWQGETTIKADKIVLDDRTGDLSAAGSVVSRMLLDHTNDKTKAKEQVRSVASSKDMVYDDKLRRASYTGGAHLNGAEGDLTADKIDIYLLEGGSEMDHLEAFTSVLLKTPDGRRVAGVHLVYVAANEQYDMTGSPVHLTDESGETTGNSLTFFRSTDRIIVDGKEQRRTELKRGIKR
jgi:lipopolysaccharide export system protein LptA